MAKKAKAAQAACPCGSGKTLAECCGPYLNGEPAPDPLSLMRSRYSAYALGHDDYVRATWLPETCPATLFADDEPRPKWLGLTVHEASCDGDKGLVSFTARGRFSTGAFKMRETSRFVKQGDRWFYVDGDVRE